MNLIIVLTSLLLIFTLIDEVVRSAFMPPRSSLNNLSDRAMIITHSDMEPEETRVDFRLLILILKIKDPVEFLEDHLIGL